MSTVHPKYSAHQLEQEQQSIVPGAAESRTVSDPRGRRSFGEFIVL